MEDQLKASFGAKHMDNKLLQSFTIPKKKRSFDKFCLLNCSPHRREFSEILDTLNKGRLNVASELNSSWTFSKIKIVINDHLTEKFFEKRNEMKELGRHNRELEDRFCFLVVPNQTATVIAQHGLSTGSTTTKELGNPELGVYFFRHIDVALNFAHRKKLTSNVILIFKVLFGKVKTVQPGSATNSILDPTPNFDSHVSRKAPLWSDPFDEQVTNSLIYVYEYDSSFKPVKTPRQCLPIAAVDATFIVKKAVTASVQARLPSKHVPPGNSKLANCTVAKRIGKGKDAMVIFKSVRPPLVQTCGIETVQSNVLDKEAPTVPGIKTEQGFGVIEKLPLFQNNIALPDLSISLQQHCNVALESLIKSCMVITSKSMKDPRLLKRCDQETLKPVGQSNLNDNMNQSTLYLSFEERRVYNSIVMTGSCVKKLNKYSSFLTCSEKGTDIGLSDEDHLCEPTLNKLGIEEKPETEFAVSMSLNSLNCTNETREDIVQSEDSMSHNPNPNNKDTAYFSLNIREREPGIALLSNASCKEKALLPKQQHSNDKLNQICSRSQQTCVFDFRSLDYTKETNENGQKLSKDNGSLSQNLKLKNTNTARDIYLPFNGKERDLGLKLLPKISGEEKPVLFKKISRNDMPYKVALRAEKIQQTVLSDLSSLGYSKETIENGGETESDTNVSQNEKLKIEDSAWAKFLPFKDKNKETKTQVSESVCLNTLNCTTKTDEDKSEINQCIVNKTNPQVKSTASASFMSCEREKKDKEFVSLPHTCSFSLNMLNSIKETSINRGKSDVRRPRSQHTMLKNKAIVRTSSLLDYYKEQCLQSKKHSLKHSSSAVSKTKLLKKNNEYVTSLKRRSYSPEKAKKYKVAPHSRSEKVIQNNNNQFKPVKNYQKATSEINIALNDKKPTSIDESSSTRKLVSTAAPNEEIKYQKAKENCSLKKPPERERHEFYVPKGVREKTEKYKKVTNGKPKIRTLDNCNDSYGFVLSDGTKPKTMNVKDSVVLHLSNKINSEISVRGKNLQPSQTSPVVMSPSKTDMPSTGLGESVKDVFIDKAIQASHTKKIRNQTLAFPRNTCEDVLVEDLCFVTELENRIDWNGIFGMDLEKVNTAIGTLQSSSLRQIKEPSGLRIFPDMEINITNNHYKCAGGYIKNIVEEIGPSKEVTCNTFEDFNDLTQDHQITDSIQTDTPILQENKNDNLETLSLKVDNSVESHDTAVTCSPVPLNKALHKIDIPTIKKRLNKKRLTSVLIKKSTRRIHKFSQSEENIKVVLGMLSDEIPLCKNKRISKRLDRAILHLRKAHKRVKKSLQLVAKSGKRKNMAKSCSVQEHLTVNGKEVNSKQVESTSSQIVQTEDSFKILKVAEIQKGPTTDRKCLTESTQVMINGAFVQDSQQAKVNSNSATKMSLLTPYKVTMPSPVTPEDSSSITSITVSDKENAMPVVPSVKSPSDGKEKHIVSCKTTYEDSIKEDGGQKKRFSSKLMFSQIKKQSSSLTILVSKSLSKKSHTINEKNRLKGKKLKEFACITTKSATNSSLLLRKLSKLLQKASETDSLQALQEYQLMCQKMIPAFIKAFEKMQHCALKDVIVDRRLFVRENLKTCFKCTLKPQAVETFLELQMMIETSQYVENRMHYMEGLPTFRSLLWYDRSLYPELLTGKSGFQQQSNFYLTFQEKLKLNSLTTLENHYTQLSEFLQTINEKDSCYYVYLKYKRELQECEDVLENNYDHAAFALSVPFTCGVYLGDTIDDLKALQNSTLEIIRSFFTLPKCDEGKKEHALSLLEVISAKIEHIKTSVSRSIQLSLFGIEHLLFDAAKVMAFNERKQYGGQRTITKELTSQINSIALSKLYEVYCAQCEQPVDTKKCSSSEIFNHHISLEFFGNQNVFLFGKIIDQALGSEPGVLEKMIQFCHQHLEFQTKCFQILQECIVDEVIIQETNVVDMADRHDKYTTLLKPEAVEAYIDLAMTYETLHFLNCLVASKNGQVTTRGLLWYDTSLFSDLIHNQYRVQSFYTENIMASALDIIESTISEIKSELEVISNCSNSVNYTYAFQIMTRELSELSELKNFMKSKPVIATYIHFSPFVVSLHYGNSLTELDHNYNQLSEYLGVLMSTPKKDLGKSAHTMKIMKTIEITKALVFKPGISTFDFIACNVLHNKKKNRQALKRQNHDEEQILHSQSPRKSGNISAEDPTSPSCKKQKVSSSPEKASIKEKENQIKSHLRPKKFEMLTTVHENRHGVKKDCLNGSQLRESKLGFSTSPKHRREYITSALEVGRTDRMDSKTRISDQNKFKNVLKIFKEDYSLAGKCQESLLATDKCELTLDAKVQPQADSIESGSFTCVPDSKIPLESENVRIPPEEKDPSLDDNMSIVCSSDISSSEEQENMIQLNSATEEQQRMNDIKPTGTEELQNGKSTTWDSQSIPTAGGQYPQFPVSASPWQYSFYYWYQNGNNAGRVTQGYPHVSYNTQSTNPYNQSSAFAVPNSYNTNQPYSDFNGQIQAQMYSVSGPFGANLPYNYADPSSSSNQNPVPNPYSYSSTGNTGWPWSSWQ
ncbi:testis-expressed protein 15 isoform X2 [Hyla sarda]|nr:testis-expressed protein 15 isoform X2 [Hyla sarda]XP_056425427.1 testis-expressed protein 15 isoform X2 [Hyla sarda]XP_056425430.1 testis-expressed protein 15 isoform X2 [Hyla sarda]XP_056425434.1 testis-expressed protein 15 isoform X2 [Hyla sarda]XP_056425439.1 testis-expressed protein 15 isoform X2 [Hyla sarda]XP_056425445.1 testis-expressed protein 15 isoform X2 [Hyla sarda]XP_056425452.1 testis-expressed protein 15 isoform X2 [Hyla sarda]XP_056425458.1 testis-expressed protein 15 iso